MRFILFIILFSLVGAPAVAKKTHQQEADWLLKQAEESLSTLQFVASIKFAKQALNVSIDGQYGKGEVYAQLYMAKALHEVGLQSEALSSIEAAQTSSYASYDFYVQAELLLIRGRIASRQKLYTMEEECYMKLLNLSSRISHASYQKMAKIQAYFYLQHLYTKQHKVNEAREYQQLLSHELASYSESNKYYYLSALYADQANLCIYEGGYDEAARWLEKSLQVIQKEEGLLLVYTMQTYGNMELTRGDSAKAIAYFKEALVSSEALHINEKTMEIHQILADCLMGSEATIPEALLHRKAYKAISDSLNRCNKKVADTILNVVLKEKDLATQKSRQRLAWVLYGFMVLILGVGVVLFFKYKAVHMELRKKQKQLHYTAERVVELEKELDQTLYEEILALAKSNSPEFLPLFAKGYPEFVATMQRLNDKIRSSELSFLALIFLGFSTKEIAEYTFVTPRAVQVRKNRLRKKYSIPSDVDFNEWIKELIAK